VNETFAGAAPQQLGRAADHPRGVDLVLAIDLVPREVSADGIVEIAVLAPLIGGELQRRELAALQLGGLDLGERAGLGHRPDHDSPELGAPGRPPVIERPPDA
jgi:hypothetical protein